jgi:hypothetical protein
MNSGSFSDTELPTAKVCSSSFDTVMEQAQASGKCPFSQMAASSADDVKLSPTLVIKKSSGIREDATSVDKEQGSEAANNAHCKYSIGLSPNRLKDSFPFHLVVNSRLEIIQVGDKLARMILDTHHKESIIQSHVSKFFILSTPPNYPWDWHELVKLEETTVELVLVGSIRNVSFRGSFIVMSPEKDGSYVPELSAMFLININVHSIDEMSDLNLKLSDFPRHNCQRDLLIIGEHLKSEASSAVELGVLSKKLNQESKTSLVRFTNFTCISTCRSFMRMLFFIFCIL